MKVIFFFVGGKKGMARGEEDACRRGCREQSPHAQCSA